MKALKHNESASGWQMRHPIVCILDVVGIVAILALVVGHRPSFTAAVLPAAIVIQYSASLLHHWRRYSEWRSKLDRSIIFLVIGATYVPYWGGLLPAAEATERLPWVALATASGISFLLLGASDLVLAMYLALFASAGLVISFHELQIWLPQLALTSFWIGSALYGLQQLAYEFKTPDLWPELFGFREIQHSILLAATVIGSEVALTYTSA